MKTERGLERLLFFSDAVVAIAITLLVLPLVELAPDSDDVGIGELLSDHGAELGAFVLSFIVIARLWRVHHRIFEGVEGYDSTLMTLTMLWLVTVVFLPFPTELLGSHYGDGVAPLYVGTLLASSLALGATDAWIHGHPELLQDGALDADHHSRWTTTVLLAVALAVVVAVPSSGMWPLLILLLTGPIDALRRRGDRPPP